MDFKDIPFITIATFMMVSAIKSAVNRDGFNRFIPLLSLVIGALVGACVFLWYPAILLMDNILSAVFYGAANGLAATGLDQTIRQIFKKEVKNGSAGATAAPRTATRKQ